MNVTIPNSQSKRAPHRRWVWSTLILIAIGAIIALFLTYQSASRPAAPAATVIPASLLEERYGLRVNLIGVTAAGGLIDLRLKLIDGEKAKSLLKDPDHFPSLWIADGNISLVVSEENRPQEIDFEDDGNLFLMFPNARGIVKPGTPVSVRFGDVQVEAIPAK